jgi:23S rRNA (uracil1939-C5)-methyltransferase
MSWLKGQGCKSLLDLFSGIGNFSLPLAKAGFEVQALEYSASSIAQLKKLATANEIDSLNARVENLFEKDISSLLSQHDAVVLDPPRAGAEAVCKQLAESEVQAIVYISCDPATLARDAKILQNAGYQLISAGIVNMFPQTSHMESMAFFSK